MTQITEWFNGRLNNILHLTLNFQLTIVLFIGYILAFYFFPALAQGTFDPLQSLYKTIAVMIISLVSSISTGILNWKLTEMQKVEAPLTPLL